METIDERLATEIRVALARQRLSQSDLARALGVSAPYVTRRMRGDLSWTVSELDRIAAWLGLSVADLLPGVMQPFRGAWALAA